MNSKLHTEHPPIASSPEPLDICLVGETNLDLILYGLPEEMPLERELLADRFEMTLGGSLVHSSRIISHSLVHVSDLSAK